MHKNYVSSFKVNLGNAPQRKDFENLRHLSQEQAARVLGISLSTFKRKLREFDPRIKWSTKAERQEMKGGSLEPYDDDDDDEIDDEDSHNEEEEQYERHDISSNKPYAAQALLQQLQQRQLQQQLQHQQQLQIQNQGQSNALNQHNIQLAHNTQDRVNTSNQFDLSTNINNQLQNGASDTDILQNPIQNGHQNNFRNNLQVNFQSNLDDLQNVHQSTAFQNQSYIQGFNNNLPGNLQTSMQNNFQGFQNTPHISLENSLQNSFPNTLQGNLQSDMQSNLGNFQNGVKREYQNDTQVSQVNIDNYQNIQNLQRIQAMQIKQLEALAGLYDKVSQNPGDKAILSQQLAELKKNMNYQFASDSYNQLVPTHDPQSAAQVQLSARVLQEVQALKSSNMALQQMLSHLTSDNAKLASLLKESEQLIQSLITSRTPISGLISKYLGDMNNLEGPWSKIAKENKCAMFVSDENCYIIATNDKFHEILKYSREDAIKGLRIPQMLQKKIHDDNYFISTIKRLYYSGINYLKGNHSYVGKDRIINLFDHHVHIETDPRSGSRYAWHELYLIHSLPESTTKAISFSPDFIADDSPGRRPKLTKDGPMSDTDFSIEEHLVYTTVNALVDKVQKKKETEKLLQLGYQPQEYSSVAKSPNIQLEDLSGNSTLAPVSKSSESLNTPTSKLAPLIRSDSSSNLFPTNGDINGDGAYNIDAGDSLFSDYAPLSPFSTGETTPRSPAFSFDMLTDSANDRPSKRRRLNNDYEM